MSDVINRQDAIDAADKIIDRDTIGNNDVVKAMTAWKEFIKGLPSVEPERKSGRWPIFFLSDSDVPDINVGDMIYRQAAIEYFVTNVGFNDEDGYSIYDSDELRKIWTDYFDGIPSAQPETAKYEYHYDHTDCIWYRPEARNRCPVTCAQYRDGWNDAMNYVFRDGEGYRPYRRDKKYEEGQEK